MVEPLYMMYTNSFKHALMSSTFISLCQISYRQRLRIIDHTHAPFTQNHKAREDFVKPSISSHLFHTHTTKLSAGWPPKKSLNRRSEGLICLFCKAKNQSRDHNTDTADADTPAGRWVAFFQPLRKCFGSDSPGRKKSGETKRDEERQE